MRKGSIDGDSIAVILLVCTCIFFIFYSVAEISNNKYRIVLYTYNTILTSREKIESKMLKEERWEISHWEYVDLPHLETKEKICEDDCKLKLVNLIQQNRVRMGK